MKALVVGGAMHDVYIVPKKALVQRFACPKSEFNYSLLVPDEKLAVEKVLSHAGGGAVNVSTSLNKMGLQVTTLCKVGKDWPGKGVQRFLREQGIDASKIVVSDEMPTGLSYIIMCSGSGHIIFCSKLANCEIKVDEVAFDQVDESDFVYISSLEGNSVNIFEPIIKRAKDSSVKVAVNPGSSQLTKHAELLERMMGSFDVFIVNFVEAKMLAGSLSDFKSCFQDDQFQIKLFLEKLIRRGVGRAVVTNGSQGIYLAGADYGLFHPGIKVKVVDSVGAGDAFGSVFSASLFQGLSVERSLKTAMASSVSVIQSVGATGGLLSMDDLERGFEQIPKGLTRKFELNSRGG